MTLFGTDGIRGLAGKYPLDPLTVRRAAGAAMGLLARRRPGAPFLLARDTRASGLWIRDVILGEARRRGIPVADAGVLPTPAAVLMIPAVGGCGGVVVSASHNPAPDNGLKFLDGRGWKLADADEAAVTAEVRRAEEAVAADAPVLAGRPGESDPDVTVAPELLLGRGGGIRPLPPRSFEADPAMRERYLRHLLGGQESLDEPKGPPVIVDCAHGAASPVVSVLAQWLPRRLLPIHAAPDGFNINDRCGATHPEALVAAVWQHHAALGFALDGDGDRIVVAGPDGRLLDGDALLYIFASHLLDGGRLPGPAVVGTVMTNLGLEEALGRRGIRLIRTPVGDRFVQARLLADGLALGGEPSGHLILAQRCPSGDGLLAGVFLLEILAATGRSLEELLAGYQPFPSKIYNLRANRKPPLDTIAAVGRLREAVDGCPAARGRTVIRYSGTEPLLRVMVEAEDLAALLPAIEPLIQRIGQEVG
jgi:phosphoglucosamine mutase